MDLRGPTGLCGSLDIISSILRSKLYFLRFTISKNNQRKSARAVKERRCTFSRVLICRYRDEKPPSHCLSFMCPLNCTWLRLIVACIDIHWHTTYFCIKYHG